MFQEPLRKSLSTLEKNLNSITVEALNIEDNILFNEI